MNKAGYLYCERYNQNYGEIGKKTNMIDFNGKSLFVGDLVTVQAMPFDDDEKNKIAELLSEIGIVETPFKPIVTLIAENNGECFVLGIKSDYSNKAQSDRWMVKKIVDHTAVMNNTVIKEIRYCLPIFEKEEKENERVE